MTSLATIETTHQRRLPANRLSFVVCSVSHISAVNYQIHLNQCRVSPDTGISTYFLW
jgi:hypothetical protein